MTLPYLRDQFSTKESFTIHLFEMTRQCNGHFGSPERSKSKFEVKVERKINSESDPMFGKISQEIQGTGTGYIITEGTATISKFNKNEITITFKENVPTLNILMIKLTENLSGFESLKHTGH
ncbi:MAG: hypothetical protein IPL23_02885 [Saprospiraceae bacterium]|nr:hypothetical protein [Saprospiraceae bacterium]